MERLEQIKHCRHCGSIININAEICSYCKLDTTYKTPSKMKTLSFKECTDLINDAFFKLEMFMNGKQKSYKYFGFNDHFTKLFELANEMKNYTQTNWDLVGDYLTLIHDIEHTLDKGIDIVSSAFEDEYFNNDCNELSTLSNYRVQEFLRFDDTLNYEYKRTTILDLLESQPQQNDIVKADKVKKTNKPKKEFKDFFNTGVKPETIEKIQKEFKDCVGKKLAYLIYLLHKEFKTINYSIKSRIESRKQFISSLKGGDFRTSGIDKYFELNDVNLSISQFEKDNDYITIKEKLSETII